jgi:hypothetical protein
VTRRLEPSGSYLSSSEPMISLPLSDGERVEGAVVTWPGGVSEQFSAFSEADFQADAAAKILRSHQSSKACPNA